MAQRGAASDPALHPNATIDASLCAERVAVLPAATVKVRAALGQSVQTFAAGRVFRAGS